jgi:hypothetical protein
MSYANIAATNRLQKEIDFDSSQSSRNSFSSSFPLLFPHSDQQKKKIFDFEVKMCKHSRVKRKKKQHIAKNEIWPKTSELKDAHTKKKEALCTSLAAEKEKGEVRRVILIQFAIKALARPFIFSLKARLKGQFN